MGIRRASSQLRDSPGFNTGVPRTVARDYRTGSGQVPCEPMLRSADGGASPVDAVLATAKPVDGNERKTRHWADE